MYIINHTIYNFCRDWQCGNTRLLFMWRGCSHNRAYRGPRLISWWVASFIFHVSRILREIGLNSWNKWGYFFKNPNLPLLKICLLGISLIFLPNQLFLVVAGMATEICSNVSVTDGIFPLLKPLSLLLRAMSEKLSCWESTSLPSESNSWSSASERLACSMERWKSSMALSTSKSWSSSSLRFSIILNATRETPDVYKDTSEKELYCRHIDRQTHNTEFRQYSQERILVMGNLGRL